jgi:hypothetical protein
MSIQSSINAVVGSIGVIKRAHDATIRQAAMKQLEEQKQAKQDQKLALRQEEARLLGKKLDIREFEAKNVRKQLNIEAKKLREETKRNAT